MRTYSREKRDYGDFFFADHGERDVFSVVRSYRVERGLEKKKNFFRVFPRQGLFEVNQIMAKIYATTATSGNSTDDDGDDDVTVIWCRRQYGFLLIGGGGGSGVVVRARVTRTRQR